MEERIILSVPVFSSGRQAEAVFALHLLKLPATIKHHALCYEWDESKRAANIAKHGTDFHEAEQFDWTTAIAKTEHISQADWDTVDSPSLDSALLAAMKPVSAEHPAIPARVCGPTEKARKSSVAVRLDEAVVASFRATGRGLAGPHQ